MIRDAVAIEQAFPGALRAPFRPRFESAKIVYEIECKADCNLICPSSGGVLRGQGAALSSAVFSPNGKYVVTASTPDRTVRLWDAESGREIAVLTDKRGVTIGNPALTRAEFFHTVDGGNARVVQRCQDA